MVRVLSVHQFECQRIQSCEEVLAIAPASRDRLLIATHHHQIQVLDLSAAAVSCPPASFPTVDQVTSLHYCLTGNYVATVEQKTGSRAECMFARVYTHWEREEGGGGQQPMRARIAGRVTPSCSSSGGLQVLEMIELPWRYTRISHIAVSQETGNLLIASDRILSLFQLVSRTHDISRLKFLDFELWPVTLELSFTPQRLRMSEDLVAASNASSLHVFRLNKGFARTSDWSSQKSTPLFSKDAKKKTGMEADREERGRQTPIDLDLLLKEVLEETEDGGGGGRMRRGREVDKLRNVETDLPVLASLPSLSRGRSSLKHCPFKPTSSLRMGVSVKEIPVNEPWTEQMTTMVESLLTLELTSEENFTSLDLTPLYRLKTASRGASSSEQSAAHSTRRDCSEPERSCPRLRSSAYGSLVAFHCLVTTAQEGYLYQLGVHEGQLSLGKCISEYNFTSRVQFALLEESSLLQCLTSSGLETYTTRSLHHLFHQQQEEEDSGQEAGSTEACPSVDEPICLLGLRPFLNVVNLLRTETNLHIVSSPRDQLSSTPGRTRSEKEREVTVYSLQQPPDSPLELYSQLLASALPHLARSPPVYLHLLSEAHTLIRSHVQFTTSHLEASHRQPSEEALHLYRESCALLSDFYLTRGETEEDWELGYRYSTMGGLTPTDVMGRLTRLERSEGEVPEGVGHYLKQCLSECSQTSELPSADLSRLLELAETSRRGRPQGAQVQLTAASAGRSPSLVSLLVLQSSLLRQFSTGTSIRLIRAHISSDGDRHTEEEEGGTVEDLLALASLYLARGKQSEARQTLARIQSTSQRNQLVQLLNTYWTLLFDSTKQLSGGERGLSWETVSLSELAVLLMDSGGPLAGALASVLGLLVVERGLLQLHHLIQVFLTYLPSRMDTGGCGVTRTLQLSLEKIFNGWYWKRREAGWTLAAGEDKATREALKILIRSYLSDILAGRSDQWTEETESGEILGGTRPQFLDLLPPLSAPPGQSQAPQCSTSLIKLQCLLSSEWFAQLADESLVMELLQFVRDFLPHETGFSLQVLTLPVDSALQLLAHHYPAVLPQYAKEMLKTEAEYRQLIALIQSKVEQEIQANDTNQIFSHILDEVLTGLARSLSCELFSRLVPAGKEFEGYILTSQQAAHAAHLQDVIKMTGHKLMATLNIKTFT